MRNLNQIMTFVEVVNRRSFAETARHLKISPAAVSKQIFCLEKELGIQLLTRSTRRIDLTSDGAIYFEHAKNILEALRQADAAISHTKEEPLGMLKALCGPQFGSKYVIPYVKEFLTRYPKLNLMIEFSQEIPDLEKEKIDLIVGLSSSIPSNCIQRSLIYTRNVLCASPSYLKTHGTPQKPSDLKNHRLIAHTMGSSNDLLTFKDGETIRVDPIVYYNDTRAMRASALDGIGIVKLHDYIVSKDIKDGTLIEILGKYNEQKKTIPLYIAYPQTSHLHVKVRKFIDFILEKI